MASNRFSVGAQLCLLLFTWTANGRPWKPEDQHHVAGVYRKPDGSVTINTGPTNGGTVNIMVYTGEDKWSHGQNGLVDIQEITLATTSRPVYQHITTPSHHVKTTRPPYTTTTQNHHVTTTRPPYSTTVAFNQSNIIVAPPIPRECPDGEKPDMFNNCREIWEDFSRMAVGSKSDLSARSPSPPQTTARSTSVPQTTARTASVAHHTRKQSMSNRPSPVK